MNATQLIERPDYWILPITGAEIAQCWMDYALTLVFGELDESFELRIEQPFTLVRPNGEEMSLDPAGDPDGVGPALALLQNCVTEAIAHKDGRLEIEFDGGAAVRIAGGGEFEPWNLVGPRGLRIVSVPDGGLTIWSGDRFP